MAPRRPIYLDHHATTPVDPRVYAAMEPYFVREFGNAASRTHVYGWRAAAAVDAARERIAEALGARPAEIVFTSGATESNNLALFGAARARRAHGRDTVVTLATEHPSVLDPVRALEREGVRVRVVPVEPDGLVDPERLREAVDERTAVVSAMAANNEIGVLQPLAAIAEIAREHGAWMHSDAAQAAGRLPLVMGSAPGEPARDALAIDLLSISGHKIYGPKGVGALYVRGRRPRVRLEPLLHGGGHEGGLRPGTLPVPLVVGLAEALALCLAERETEWERLGGLRDALWERLREALPGVRLNGHPTRRLPGNLNVSFEGIEIDKLLLALPDLAVSSGSACASSKPAPSHVLLAIGLDERLARASLRFGLGRSTSAQDVATAADRVIEAVRQLRAG